ncbi:LytR C-terminal domain-containing protein [Patescibacteria group bacterium]|nr:LytR C-terminal domain-containing protein [Patescibacteria group bacterium]MBU4098830.1 LytR C-terminal domain-containing protein [Patescibacteria group bacterium]
MRENGSGYQTFADYTMRPEERGSKRAFIFIVLFILIAVLGGLFIIGALNKKPKKSLPVVVNIPTVTPLPTSSVSAVLKPNLTGEIYPTTGLSSQDKLTNLDRSKLSVSVLNGSGEKGAAKQVSSYLESLGYKIVKVDNAEVFSYRNLTVQVKRSKSAYASLLKKDLQSNPAYASVSASVSDEIASDAEVIVGK